ncbi:integrin alpha-X-like [Silurus asotus]|uniref:Integrin alpha-X-like n=1 Tax=Silurus asotus TaxID=30991 RepID=A0AAD5AFN6_SILAS|nr:integrin alpha-X-like [Silurus asotus]
MAVCSPHVQQECEGFHYLQGVCVELNASLKHSYTHKPVFQECHVIPPLDAVILFDDSQSIRNEDFIKMINFIKDVIRSFTNPRAQVAVAKFSSRVSAVFQFENFAADRNADNLMSSITHSQGDTYTPSAIRFVLEEMFQESVGMRNNSQKLLIVVTDGKSNDKNDNFRSVIDLANKRGVTRFAIGVGEEYSREELEQIASDPRYVFETPSFSSLSSIVSQLTERIFSIEGTNVGNSSSIQLELSQGGFSVALSEELGSYFGAELCVVYGDDIVLLAVGAPMFYAAGVGGEALRCQGVLRGLGGNVEGRFGSALAALQDLNEDRVMELAVGAPQEEQGKGAIYIFTSYRGGFRPKHTQRVCGTTVGQALQYFGLSLHSVGDLNSDGLPDLVVGSKGAAVVLRTQPVICVLVSFTLNPQIIPQDLFHCSAPHGLNTPIANATMCLKLREVSTGMLQGSFHPNVSVFLELDFGSPSPRLLFYPMSSILHWNTTLSSLTPVCHTLPITIQACISDYRDVPLSGRLTVSEQTGRLGLRPVLHPDCPNTHTITQTVLLEKVESTGYIECSSHETHVRNLTHTTCRLGFTVFRKRAKVACIMSFQLSKPAALRDRVDLNVTVKSKNENPETLHDNSVSVSVPVKQLVHFLLRDGGSTQYIQYNNSALLQHTYELSNLGDLSTSVSVVFVLPLETSGLLWDVSPPDINVSDAKCEKPMLLKNVNTSNYSKVESVQGLAVRDGAIPKPGSDAAAQDALNGPFVKQIVSVVESVSQVHTALIASLSVLFGVVVMIVLFVGLYKVGFFKSKSFENAAQEADGTTSTTRDGNDSNTPHENTDGQTEANSTHTHNPNTSNNSNTARVMEEKSVL